MKTLWTRNLNEIPVEFVEESGDSPSGSRSQMWLLGMGLALLPFGYGVYCLFTGRAVLIGRGNQLELTGSTAVALAIAYMAGGLFIHAHWFWGLHPRLAPFSPILKAVAALIFLGGLGFTIYRVALA